MIVFVIAAFVSTATVGPSCKEHYKPEHEDADFMVRDCRGAGEYKIRIDVEDARDDVIVYAKDHISHELKLDTIAKDSFSSVRGAAYWWMEKKTPTALVFRFSVQDDTDERHKDIDHYIVAKITPEAICVVFDENKLAVAKKRAKDAATAPCLFAK